MLFYLSKWYTKSELSLRMAIFYSASLLSGAFGNLIAAGILQGLDGNLGLAPWQWLYIVEGSITMAVGIVILFILPDFPHTWKLLSPEMKHVANRRMAIDAAEADIDEAGAMSQLRGLKLAMKDPKVRFLSYHRRVYRTILTFFVQTYLIAVAYHGITGATGFQNFVSHKAGKTHVSSSLRSMC